MISEKRKWMTRDSGGGDSLPCAACNTSKRPKEASSKCAVDLRFLKKTKKYRLQFLSVLLILHKALGNKCTFSLSGSVF